MDNTKIDIGTTGDDIATDDIEGVKYQRMKVTLGADGENDGDVSADNPMPVSGAFYPATQPVSAASLPLPGGAASSANQTVLETLVDTLQELVQRLAPLGSAMNIAGGNGLRIVGVGGTYAVTGPLTSAQYTASNLTSRQAVENQTAVLANINNCVGA
jgi:hypothetical protein